MDFKSSRLDDLLRSSCRVDECDSKHTHTTDRHICFYCKHTGHGLSKCKLLDKLMLCKKCDKTEIVSQKLNSSFFTKKCNECQSKIKTYRKSSCGHIVLCSGCFSKCEQYCDTPEGIFVASMDSFQQKYYFGLSSKLSTKQGKVCTSLYVGMGCIVFGRRDHIGDKLKIFFLHSDSRGQYLLCDNMEPYTTAFCRNYTII